MLLCLHCHTRSHTHLTAYAYVHVKSKYIVHDCTAHDCTAHDCTAHDLDRGGRQFRSFFSSFLAFWDIVNFSFFRQKWGGHGRPGYYGSDAPVPPRWLAVCTVVLLIMLGVTIFCKLSIARHSLCALCNCNRLWESSSVRLNGAGASWGPRQTSYNIRRCAVSRCWQVKGVHAIKSMPMVTWHAIMPDIKLQDI